MSAGPDVTVIVPVYNGETTIAACVASLLASDFLPGRVEFLVVDNASTDGTRSILDRFGEQVTVLTERTRGVSAARNRGIREARGHIVAFTDADCEVERGWLAALVAPLGDPSVGIAGGRILSRLDGNRIERYGERIHDHRRAIVEDELPYVISMNWASRTEILHEAGLFDESLLRGQDVDLSWRIQRCGYRLAYAPDAVIRHHNERTIRGLVHEGYVHGLHSVRLREKHAALDARVQPPRSAAARRMLGDLRRLPRGNVVDGLLTLLFDAGKSAGEIVGLARAADRNR
ncbi:MAG: glycosyltransferase [Gemmatimonadota bacterium]